MTRTWFHFGDVDDELDSPEKVTAYDDVRDGAEVASLAAKAGRAMSSAAQGHPPPTAPFTLEIGGLGELTMSAESNKPTEHGAFALVSEQLATVLERFRPDAIPIKEPPRPPRAAGQKKGRFHLYSVEDLERLPEPRWLINGLVPEDGLVLLYGAEGTYKTFLVLDWALSVSAGLPWQSHPVKKGDVVYVYAEGVKGLPKRIRAWRSARGGDIHRFHVLPTSLDVRNEARQLVAAIRAASLSPTLVVIDTLARNFGDGDENTQKDMNAFVRGCDMIRNAFQGATVLVVHHQGKKAKSGDRGSTVLRGAADAVMHLSAKDGTAFLDCEKQKDAEPFRAIKMTPRQVRLDAGGSSVLLEPARTGSEQVLDRAVRTLANETKALNALKGFRPHGATYSEWLTASEMADSTFKDVRKRLLTTNKIAQTEDRYFAVPEEAEGREAETRPDQYHQPCIEGRKGGPEHPP